MVTILAKTTQDSIITAATLEVTGARNSAHALNVALDDLDRHGWLVSIERYEAVKNDNGSYTLTVY